MVTLEEADDNEKILWDLRSDFEKLSHTGYRNAILGDFEEEEAEGRLRGFQKSFQYQSNMNHTSLLSRIDGFLTGCLIKCHMSEEQCRKVLEVQEEIKWLLQCYYNPGTDILDRILCETEDSSKEKRNLVLEKESNQYSRECCLSSKFWDEKVASVYERSVALGESVGWMLPSHINMVQCNDC